MRCGIAVWNLMEPAVGLLERVGQFADMGFDTMSFLPGQLLDMPAAQAEGLLRLMDDRGLSATVHGNFNLSLPQGRRIVDMLGGRLLCLTFDAAMRADSRGTFFDVARMRPLLEGLLEGSPAGPLRLAVEDFPLDRAALDHYRRELGPLVESERFGILIDVGHMNLRIRKEAYFAGLSVRQYIARAPLPIVEVHLHDNAGDRDSHGHFGLGDICFSEVAAGLREAGFDGVSTIEFAPSLHGRSVKEAMPHVPEGLSAWRGIWQGLEG